MKDRKLAVGLLVSVVFAGGCVLTPYDPEEETEISAFSELSTAQTGSNPEQTANDTRTPSDPTNGTQSAPSTVVDTRLNSEPAKPQPDPWDEIRWRSLNSSPR